MTLEQLNQLAEGRGRNAQRDCWRSRVLGAAAWSCTALCLAGSRCNGVTKGHRARGSLVGPSLDGERLAGRPPL